MRKLSRFIKPWSAQFFWGSTAKLSEAILELLQPLMMAKILDEGIPSGDKSYILKVCMGILILSIVGFALAFFAQYSATLASQGTGKALRSALMDKIAEFSYNELDKFGTGTLITRVSADVNNVQIAVGMTIRLVFRAPFVCVGAVILSMMVDMRLALIFVVMIPLLGLLLYLFAVYSAPLYKAVQKKMDKLADVVQENISGVRVIRAFARWEVQEKRGHEASGDVAAASLAVGRVAALTGPVTSVLMYVATVALLFFGAYRVLAGQMEAGSILALTAYSTQILYSLIIVSNLVVIFTKAAASTARINEVLDTEPSITFVQENAKLNSAKPAAVFSSVYFSYGGGEDAVEDVSFALPRGQTLGIVGVTGSGKSTLLALLQRFYDVDKGEVSLFGNALRAYPQQQLRNLVGVVPQQSLLFSGTVADNLRWGKQDASDEEMWQALRTAQAEDFVRAMPEGLHTLVFEGGKNFSGGQRQRLCIARALVKKPEILILDDSLSALDYKTDLALRQALGRDLPNVSMVVVSQRISSVAASDNILLVDEGKITASGTHENLLESSETYCEIYRSQTDVAGGAKK